MDTQTHKGMPSQDHSTHKPRPVHVTLDVGAHTDPRVDQHTYMHLHIGTQMERNRHLRAPGAHIGEP